MLSVEVERLFYRGRLARNLTTVEGGGAIPPPPGAPRHNTNHPGGGGEPPPPPPPRFLRSLAPRLPDRLLRLALRLLRDAAGAGGLARTRLRCLDLRLAHRLVRLALDLLRLRAHEFSFALGGRRRP